jgi:hypothetical protein
VLTEYTFTRSLLNVWIMDVWDLCFVYLLILKCIHMVGKCACLCVCVCNCSSCTWLFAKLCELPWNMISLHFERAAVSNVMVNFVN